MKKTFLIMLGVIFVVCQAHAQNEVTDSLKSESVTSSDLAQISALMTDLNAKFQNAEIDPCREIFVPTCGKSKFARSHYIYQTIEISTIAGKDGDDDPQDGSQSNSQEISGDNVPNPVPKVNLGLNVGYSIIFVPGEIQGDKLKLNRFGFAYSTGLIAAFDRQEKYGVTCDFLFKIGVETGNGHPLGIGFDTLIGTGKSAGMIFDLNDEAEEPYYYTDWCFKYGVQIWLKTNLLATNIKNSDLLVFARYVKSKNPCDDELLLEAKLLNFFFEEAWQFGVTFRYRFWKFLTSCTV